MPVKHPHHLLLPLVALSLVLPLPAWPATPAFDLAPLHGDQPPSPLVERMQEILQRLGYYQGTVDGLMSTSFIDAIRAYQNAYDLPVTGRLSPDLQQHIENFGLPYGLMNRLDEARTGNREAARKALASQVETRDLLATLPADAGIADPLRDQDRCLRAPSVKCLVDEAGESAKAVNRPEYRQWVLRDIMKAQTVAGLLPEARQTIRRLADPRYIIVALREQAEILASSGQPAAAEKLAATIPTPRARLRALAAIAPALVSEPAALRRLLDRLISELPKLRPAFDAMGIATELAQTLGELKAQKPAHRVLDAAATVMETLKQPDLRQKAEFMLLDGRARTGVDGALEQLKARLDTEPRADRYQAILLSSYARLRHEENATEASAALNQAELLLPRIDEGYAADFAAAQIAATHVALGNIETGLARILEIGKDDLRIRTLWRVAGFVGGGDTSGPSPADLRRMALSQARELANDFERANLLSQISLWYLALGETGSARDSFNEALEAAGGMESPWWRARAFARMALVLARLDAAARD